MGSALFKVIKSHLLFEAFVVESLCPEEDHMDHHYE